MKNKAFTLAEVLITLAIIGVVAALSIPSVIVNTQQQQFKTGLKKAVSVLNQAITTNIALEGESPADNDDLFNYMRQHMSVMMTVTRLNADRYHNPEKTKSPNSYNNAAFYTTDGMRFEFYRANHYNTGDHAKHLYNSEEIAGEDVTACLGNTAPEFNVGNEWAITEITCGGCGSKGIVKNPAVDRPPCLITVDVNGDKKPNPDNANCKTSEGCTQKRAYKYAVPDGSRVTDVFSILITDEKALPYGTAAQRAMYEK